MTLTTTIPQVCEVLGYRRNGAPIYTIAGGDRNGGDAMLDRLVRERADRLQFVDQLTAEAQEAGRDLSDSELELMQRAQARSADLDRQIAPLRAQAEQRRAADDQLDDLNQLLNRNGGAGSAPAGPVSYRSAGEYISDRWRAAGGVPEARARIDRYHRAAAHQTTGDNPGLLPEAIVGPVVNFVDDARPFVAAIGPRDITSGPRFYRPKVTSHSQVGLQNGEKTELPSRKLRIDRLPVDVSTYGGYVNVSRQDIDWSSPAILDMVVADLASEYAIETEAVACANAVAAATPAGKFIDQTSTAVQVAGALWAAAGQAYAALRGAGRLILAVSPDMLGVVGPLFAPINAQNAQSTGFAAGSFGSGVQAAVSGITTVMSAGFEEGTALVVNSAAYEAYEDRIGSLQVIEPSVLGTQIAYAGYFADLVLDAAGIIALTEADA